MRHVCGAPGQGLGCAASARGPMLAALPCGVSRPPPRARLLLARVGEEQQDLSGIQWLTEQENAIKEQALEEEAAIAAGRIAQASAPEEPRAYEPVGMHIRGKSTVYENVFDENDPARFQYHRKLASLALQGDYEEAGQVLGQMMQDGFTPGPRAYHAVIFSNVRGDNAAGALAVLQEASNAGSEAGFQPLPESYAVVLEGFAQEGDLDSAEAVYASNRRAGVNANKSWCAIVTALLEAFDTERAFALLAQGEAEEMVPNARVYACVIESLCCSGQLEEAMQRLMEMHEREVEAGMAHVLPIIQAQALDGDMQVAEQLAGMAHLYGSGTLDQKDQVAILSAYHAIMEGLLYQGLPSRELSSRVAAVRQQLVHASVVPDARMHTLFLEAALLAGDVQSAMAAFGRLERCVTHFGPLEYLPIAAFVDFLWKLSSDDRPSLIYKLLAHLQAGDWQAPSGCLPLQAAIPRDNGCTFLGAWLHVRMQRLLEADERVVPATVPADTLMTCCGEYLHADTGEVVGGELAVLAPEDMSVRQLRAELRSRQLPTYGAQHKLVHRLQAARDRLEGADKNAAAGSHQDTELLHAIKQYAASCRATGREHEAVAGAGADAGAAGLGTVDDGEADDDGRLLAADTAVDDEDDEKDKDEDEDEDEEDGEDEDDEEQDVEESDEDDAAGEEGAEPADNARRSLRAADAGGEDGVVVEEEEEDEMTPRAWWRQRTRALTDVDAKTLRASNTYSVGILNCSSVFDDAAMGLPEAISMLAAAMRMGIAPSSADLQLLSQVIVAEDQCLAAAVVVNLLSPVRAVLPAADAALAQLAPLATAAPGFLATLAEQRQNNSLSWQHEHADNE